MYPLRAWEGYDTALKLSGEHKPIDNASNGFLLEIGLLDNKGGLTEAGKRYFESRFIKQSPNADNLIRDALFTSKPVLAVSQHLYGLSDANKDTAMTLLKYHDLADGLSERTLGTLLTMMSRFTIISYVRGAIKVSEAPMDKPVVPQSVFISRTTPYSNEAWLKRILRESEGYIHWLDKHFLPAALELIWETADGHQLHEIEILSLELEANSTKRSRAQYDKLKLELQNRGISLQWRFIDSTLVRGTHDRWVISQSTAWNLPDVGTVLSGNHSEINRSNNGEDLEKIFQSYWVMGQDMSN